MRHRWKMLCLFVTSAAIVIAPVAAVSQQVPVVKTAASKAGKGQKVCRVKMKYSGEVRTFVCKDGLAASGIRSTTSSAGARFPLSLGRHRILAMVGSLTRSLAAGPCW